LFDQTSQLFYNLPGDSDRELFKPSEDSVSLLVNLKKNFFVLCLGFCVGDVTCGGDFVFFWPPIPGPGGQSNQPFFGEVFLETRQKSTTLEHLIDFPAYLEPKLQVKNQNLAKMSVLTNLDLGWITSIFCMAITRQQIELESCSNPLSRSLLSIYLVVALHVFSKMIEFCQNVSKISGRRS